MYRRRRSHREKIAFSFDSFLDVVANVIGIVVRLILVAWVGARSYTAVMQKELETTATVQVLTPPSAADDPAQNEMERMRRELADARLRLLDQLNTFQLAEAATQEIRTQLTYVKAKTSSLLEQVELQSAALHEKDGHEHEFVASAEELRARAKQTLAQIKELEVQPRQTQVLRYHTPVSHAVQADEMFFECRHGRVTFIDLPAFLQEVRNALEDKAAALRSQWAVSSATAPIGPYRLRYTVEREKSALDGFGTAPVSGNFRYGLSEWIVEPIAAERGEPLDVAVKENSAFRRRVDTLDPQITVVTFWVYADSFELFRRLRDHLYEREIEVAGRPLTDDAPIAASRHGTASRGQ